MESIESQESTARDLPLVACATCGSTHLAWRVKRPRGPARGTLPASMVWSCRDCGAGWEEPLLPKPGEPGEARTA
jgi:hypothetical protein